MKKILFIPLALLVLFLFNSCEDKVDKLPVDPYKTITKAKSITGINLEAAQIKLTSWGYVYSGSEEISEGITLHNFTSNTSYSNYDLLAYENVIFLSIYSESGIKNTTLNKFESFSKECQSYISGKTYEYIGKTTLLSTQDSNFTTHQQFADYYVANKYNIQSCNENWETTTEVVASNYNEKAGIFNTSIMYINLPFAPETIFEKTNILKNFINVYPKQVNI